MKRSTIHADKSKKWRWKMSKTRLVRITASYNQPLDAYYRVPITMDDDDVMQYCRDHSGDTVAIGEFIEDINDSYSKEEKHSLLEFMWKIAYADGKLDVDEERLVRRVADLIRIKDIEVLKLKDLSKN